MIHDGGCVVLCCVVLCCAVLCCAVLCCAVLCCAVLCCAVLCCAVLCCAVLCCVVLCCVLLMLAARSGEVKEMSDSYLPGPSFKLATSSSTCTDTFLLDCIVPAMASQQQHPTQHNSLVSRNSRIFRNQKFSNIKFLET